MRAVVRSSYCWSLCKCLTSSTPLVKKCNASRRDANGLLSGNGIYGLGLKLLNILIVLYTKPDSHNSDPAVRIRGLSK